MGASRRAQLCQPAGSAIEPEEIATFQGGGYLVPIGEGAISTADCALAQLHSNRIPKEFTAVTAIPPQIDMRVMKDGAITGITKGAIVDIAADVYSFGAFRSKDQILISGDEDEFAWDGDSGAIVTDTERQPVAMVFAEAGEYAVACPLSAVFQQLGRLPAFQRKQPLISLGKLGRP